MAQRLKEPTYGVEYNDRGNTDYYLGDDEILWDWANAPVAPENFVNKLAEVSLPDGYVVLSREDRLVKGQPSLGITSTLVTASNTFDDKAYVLTCSMRRVSRSEFNAAGLSDERILRAEGF